MLRTTIFIIIAFSLFSCRDDFSLEAEYEDIPVAYGYLNPEDDRHFIRLEKAFLEAGGDATVNAADPDNIYYSSEAASVKMMNLTTNEEVTLSRVDGEDYGLRREEGIFATQPNILYTFSESQMELNSRNKIRLVISREGEEDAVAETTLLQDFEIRSPGDVVRPSNYNRPINVSWRSGENTHVFDIRVRFNIREFYPDDQDRNRNVAAEWLVNPSYVPTNRGESGLVRFELRPEGMYQFLGSYFQDNEGVVRVFDNFDIVVTGAGEEVLAHQTVSSANAGITSSQSIPRYSNFIGGLGILTSTIQDTKSNIQFDAEGMDSLRLGRYTKELNFQ